MDGPGAGPGDGPHYTYAGVVSWLESEWRRFHKEREIWHNEKALLCASVEQLKRLLRTSRATEAMLGRKVKMLDAKLAALKGSPVDLSDVNVGEVEDNTSFDLTQPHVALMTEAHGASPLAGEVPADAINAMSLQAVTDDKDVKPHGKAEPHHAGSEAGSAAGDWEAASSRSQVPPYVPISPPPQGAGERESSFAGKRPDNTEGKADGPSPQGELPRSPQAGTNLQPPTAVPAPVASSPRGAARLWEFKACVRGHFSAVRCGTWCEGALMVTGGDDHVVKLWDARRVLKGKEREEPITTFRGHTSPVVSLASYKDEVIAGALDGKIRIWKLPGDSSSSSRDKDREDSGSMQCICELSDHHNAVWGLSVLKRVAGDEGGLDASSSVMYFASVSVDGSMLLWKRADRVDKTPSVICRFNPTEEMLAGAMMSSFVPIHCHLSSSRLVVTYCTSTGPQLHSGAYGVAAFVPTGTGAYVWHRALPARPTALAVSPATSTAAVGLQSGRLELFSPVDGRVTVAASPHSAPVSSIDFAQQDIVLTTGHDGRVLALSTTDASTIQQIPSPHTKHFGEAVHVVLHHSGRNIVATAGADSSIAWFAHSASK